MNKKVLKKIIESIRNSTNILSKESFENEYEVWKCSIKEPDKKIVLKYYEENRD